jgi:putative transposase
VTTIAWLLGPELIDRRRLGEASITAIRVVNSRWDNRSVR